MNPEAIDEAFRASVHTFATMSDPGHAFTVVENAQIALLDRYDRVATRHSDLVDVLHLVGAVGAVVSAEEYPDRVGAMMTAMGLVTVVAASWRLAVEPILTTAMAMIPADPNLQVADRHLACELLLGVPDLVIAATFEAQPTESVEEREGRRRQMFNALGMIMTGLVLFARLMGDVKVDDVFLQALESAWT